MVSCGWLGRLMTVRDESRHEVDRKVGRTMMARMVHVKQVLELIKDGFHEGAAVQEHFFPGARVSG